MQITKLELENYKCFENLVLDNLGSRVVLVGPNGCGKSAVLESIAVLKEYVGTYHANERFYIRQIPPTGQYGMQWPDNVPLPIRGDSQSAAVTAEITLDDAEKDLAGGIDKARVGIRMVRSGEVVATLSNGNVAKIFRHFDPESGIGVVDYISPSRIFPQQTVQGLNPNAVSVETQRTERIHLPSPSYDAYQKFRYVKDFLISLNIEEFSHFQATGEDLGCMTMLREVFFDFFGPKRLLGFRQQDREFQIAIQTPNGVHDIDQLSSGEKELFFIFVNLFRIRKLPSVILYDEPERHLNAGLETRIIPALDRLQTRNQLWIATHGVELIGSVPMQDVVALKKSGESIQFERFTEPSHTNRVRLLEMLGAKVGLQLACNRVVFLEGKSSQGDKRIIDKLAGPKLSGVLFVASGSSLGAIGAATRAGLLIEEASKDATFLMVLDRDYRDAASVESLEKRLNKRVYVWKCHEVENLLLSPPAILKVLKFSGVESFKTEDEVLAALRDVAKSLQGVFVSQWTAHKIHTAGPEGDDDGIRPNDEANLRRWVENARKRSEAAYSDEAFKKAFEAAGRDVRQCFGTDRWLTELPGKEILEGFRKAYLTTIASETFKEQIVSAILDSGRMPSEIENLCEFVKSH